MPRPSSLLVSCTLAAALAALALTAAPGTAHAGSCGGDEYVLDAVKEVERYAKRGGKPPELGELCIEEALGDKRLEKRLFAACEKILAREPSYEMCVLLAADHGKRTLGGVDIYAEVAKTHGVDPFGPALDGAYNVGRYARLGDPRALAPVRAAWLTAAADKRISQRHTAHLWKVFRNNAIKLFEAQGGQEERDFLAAQLATIRDRAMKKRIEKALATLDRRLARKP